MLLASMQVSNAVDYANVVKSCKNDTRLGASIVKLTSYHCKFISS